MYVPRVYIEELNMGVKKQISMLTFVCIKKSTNYNYYARWIFDFNLGLNPKENTIEKACKNRAIYNESLIISLS